VSQVLKLKFAHKSKTILFISDLHIPYHHPDAFAFLKYLKKKLKPDLVVNVGDLADFHNVSFHDSDPDLMGAGDELIALQRYSRELEKIFPSMIIVGSNHGDLPVRKAFAGGLPKSFIRPYNEIYDVGSGWQFVDDLLLDDKGELLYVAHGISKNGLKLAAQRGVCVVQGHYHTEFRVDYISNPRDLLWSMQVGCLINPKSLAFAYNKLQLARPIIGTGATIDGVPQLFPMTFNKNSRWNKQ
jgi:hypothetical protein